VRIERQVMAVCATRVLVSPVLSAARDV
jgi:hypothetical protein